MRTLTTLATLVALGMVVSCQRTDVTGTAEPSGSSVHITQVTPPTSSSFRVGEQANLQVEVDYSLSADSGTITLVVQTSDNKVIANETEVVSKGAGKVTLKAAFMVPDTKSIQLFTPLSAQGQSSTSTVDFRAYKVEAK